MSKQEYLYEQQSQFTMPVIWFSDLIADAAIDSGLDSSYYLKVYCYLSYNRIFSFRAVVPFKHLCDFIGVSIDKHLSEKIETFNAVFEDMYERGIILDEVRFQNVNDYIDCNLNPNYFVPPTKLQKAYMGVENVPIFRYITEESFKKIITYNRADYPKRARKVSTDRLLLIYLYLLGGIHFRVDGARDIKKCIKYPLGGLFNYSSLAAQLDYEVEDVATACEILRDDLGLIFYGEPVKLVGVKKITNKRRIVVEKLPASTQRLDWQQEYINEVNYYISSLKNSDLRRGQEVYVEYPVEILEYFETLKNNKFEGESVKDAEMAMAESYVQMASAEPVSDVDDLSELF